MAEGIKTGNPFFDAWSQAVLRGSEAIGAGASAGMDWPAATREAEANWQLCERQASDWMKAAGRQMMPASGPDTTDGIAEETLRRMLDPTQFFVAGTDEVNAAIQRLVEGPDIADIGTIERQLLKATSEWVTLRQASASFKAVTAAAWSRAFASFSQDTMTDPSLLARGPRGALNHWLKVANAELIRTQRTDAFLEAQRRLLSAGVDYRLKERALVEIWCETHSIPTQTEIDDVHRSLHELRAQVRDLRSRLATAEARAARPTAPRTAAAKKQS